MYASKMEPGSEVEAAMASIATSPTSTSGHLPVRGQSPIKEEHGESPGKIQQQLVKCLKLIISVGGPCGR